ncbi:DUF3291 domain-containing protein [Sagittula salina]|uniref:DUF3291 domain-containing protein n=1 Tax=Sagittula salina TaxID=2820268 RepID=A0A940ML31_9RHOB|nr:DUF3291 domain-containing protein [Sagittula salina]MBP0481740.1 DUF3291 domain-containing protein [Sagittula salina]
MPLALYTFGHFIRPAEDAVNDGFRALNDPIFARVNRSEGLIERSGYASDPGPQPWGAGVYPRLYEERGDGWSPASLSLWTDLESPYALTYSGLHAQALRRGREWFRQGDWPPLVLWWQTDDADRPTWAQGAERYEVLHDNGASAFGFNFRQAFDRDGNLTRIDKRRVRAGRAAAGSIGVP